MMAGREMQAWIARLEAENRTITGRNRYLWVALCVGVVVLVAAVWSVYRATIGAYAVLDDVVVRQHPASQGRLEISFRVVSPGMVYYRRTGGGIQTDVIDYFRSPGENKRTWGWGYEPGRPVDVTLWYRRGLWRSAHTQSFPTLRRADLVVLIDTTGSMDRSIAELKDKCVAFSQRLTSQELEHRFALIGFGDSAEAEWLDRHDFTADVSQFQQSVARVKRFDGGDLPESALDALEEALSLPLDEQAIRRFYLVTDAPYHEPARSGATAAELACRLAESRVVLDVFSRPQYEGNYRKLTGEVGRFQEIENFGKVLSEGRVLED